MKLFKKLYNYIFSDNKQDAKIPEDPNSFHGKFIKRILVCTKLYEENSLNIQLNDNNGSEVYNLKKILIEKEYSVYDLECKIKLKSTIINFVIDDIDFFKNIGLTHLKGMKKCVFYGDDGGFNHVHDVCKNDNFLPKENEESYSVYLDCNKSAISFFITIQ